MYNFINVKIVQIQKEIMNMTSRRMTLKNLNINLLAEINIELYTYIKQRLKKTT